jgi:uncharacterized membrane protein YdjX (TVP38/TMEM64 family)
MVSLAVVIRGVALMIPVLLLGFLFSIHSVDYAPDALKEWADAEIRGAGLAGILLFIAAGAAFTAIGLSRQVFALVGGYVFGVGAGTAYALAGELGGVLLGFLYARFLARDVVARRYPNRVRKIDQFLSEHPFSMTLAVRLFPASNNLVVNLLAGVSNVPPLPFLAASAVGHLPQTLIFALVGSGIARGDLTQGALAAVLFAISVGIGWHLYRRHARGRALVEDLDGAPADERT